MLFKFWNKFNAALLESKKTVLSSDDWKWDSFMDIGSSHKVVDTVDIQLWSYIVELTYKKLEIRGLKQ